MKKLDFKKLYLMEMSKLAVKMRVDVGSMLQLADKFYEPDNDNTVAAFFYQPQI